MSTSVEEKVKGIIVEQLGVQAEEVKPEASFVDDLGAEFARHGRARHGLRGSVRHRDPGRGRREDPEGQGRGRLHRFPRQAGLRHAPRLLVAEACSPLLDARGRRRVAVTGVGLVSPVGLTTAENWANLKGGRLRHRTPDPVRRDRLRVPDRGRWDGVVSASVSLVLALGAALWAARQWPALRNLCNGGVALVLIALAWFMPALGAVCLALALCVTTSRWRLAATAALAAAWIVGAFYYQLRWPLATKSLVLVAAGALLGGLAWLALRPSAGLTALLPRATAHVRAARGSRTAIALSAIATLVVANLGIWQKEDLIATWPAGVRGTGADRPALADAGRLHAPELSASPATCLPRWAGC